MLHILSEMLVTGCTAPYQGIAWDGCHFILLSELGRVVNELDESWCVKRSKPTARSYTCLTFDSEKRCFWAACGRHPSILYKLDKEFKEVSLIRLKDCGQIAITSLSVQRCTGQIWIGHPGGVVLADRSGGTLHQRREGSHWIRGVLSLCPYALVWSCAKGVTQMWLCDGATCVCEETCFPSELCPEAAVYVPGRSDGLCHIWLLVRRCGGDFSLLDCVLESKCMPRKLCPCTQLECPSDSGGDSEGCDSDGMDDITESIALMEASLSHILNAEGEKLQKIVATTDDAQMLLAINQSVSDTIVSVTHLEQVLYQKLAAVIAASERDT